jgi:O-antigen ligase
MPTRNHTARSWIQAMLLLYLVALPFASALTPWIRDLPLWGMAAGIVFALAQSRRDPASALIRLELVVPALIFIASFGLAIALSENTAASLARARHLPIGLLLFVAIQVAIVDRQDLDRVFTALTIVAALFALDGAFDALALQLDLDGASTYQDTDRIRSSLPHPNDLAILAVLAGFAASQVSKLSRFRGLVGVALGVACVTTAVFSQSRNLWIGLGVAAVVCVGLRVTRISRSTLGLAVAALVTLPALLWLFDVGGFQDRLASLGRVSSDGRIGVWLVAWELFETHPLTGVGPFLFGDYYLPIVTRIELPVGYRPETSVVEWAHNLYLEALAERGILGLAGFLTLVGASLTRTIRGVLAEPGEDTPVLIPYSAAVLSGWLAFLTMGLFDLTFGKDWTWLILWLLVGLTARLDVAGSAPARDHGEQESQKAGRA